MIVELSSTITNFIDKYKESKRVDPSKASQEPPEIYGDGDIANLVILNAFVNCNTTPSEIKDKLKGFVNRYLNSKRNFDLAEDVPFEELNVLKFVNPKLQAEFIVIKHAIDRDINNKNKGLIKVNSSTCSEEDTKKLLLSQIPENQNFPCGAGGGQPVPATSTTLDPPTASSSSSIPSESLPKTTNLECGLLGKEAAGSVPPVVSHTSTKEKKLEKKPSVKDYASKVEKIKQKRATRRRKERAALREYKESHPKIPSVPISTQK